MHWIKVTQRVLIGGGMLVGLALATLAFFPSQPKEGPVKATITFIGAEPGDGPYAPLVRVIARTDDGKTAQMRVPSNQLRCKLGDEIPATRRGVSVYLDQASCADLGLR